MISLKDVLSKKTAIVVIDVQNDFCHPDGPFGKKGLDLSRVDKIMPNLHSLIEAANQKEIPVIYIQNCEDFSTDTEAWLARPDGDENSPNEGVTRRGSWGAELYNLSPTEKDLVIEKHRFSAFYNTRLDTALKALGIETIVCTGLATNVCVLTTATHAVMYGYHVVVAEDCCAAWFDDAHKFAINNMRLFVGKISNSSEVISLM